MAKYFLPFLFFISFIQKTYSEDKIVKLFYWADTIPKDVFQDFEKETGIKVISTVFDSDELLEAKLYAGLTGFDVIILTANPFLPNQLKAGFYQKLDKNKFINYKHLDPLILRKLSHYDPDNAHAIPFVWGTAGIGINVDKVNHIMPNAPIESWRMVFDPSVVQHFAKCGVAIIDSPTEVFPLMLSYLGYKPDSLDLKELSHALAALKKVRPFIKEINTTNYITNFANGDLCLTLGWSGNIYQARSAAHESQNGVNISYHLAKEITPMWIDILAIHKEARNVDEAHRFLDFMMKPEIAARITKANGYANGNLTSRQFISQELLNEKNLFPSPELIEKFHMDWPAPLRYEQKRVRAWEEFKSGRP